MTCWLIGLSSATSTVKPAKPFAARRPPADRLAGRQRRPVAAASRAGARHRSGAKRVRPAARGTAPRPAATPTASTGVHPADAARMIADRRGPRRRRQTQARRAPRTRSMRALLARARRSPHGVAGPVRLQRRASAPAARVERVEPRRAACSGASTEGMRTGPPARGARPRATADPARPRSPQSPC